MATNKNITMKQFNGVDYDTLYPKTKVEQVEGAYAQQQILSDSTKGLYGLGADAVPDDVLALLSRFQKGLGNEYIWEKSKTEELEDVVELTNVQIWQGAMGINNTFYVGNGFINNSGIFGYPYKLTGTTSFSSYSQDVANVKNKFLGKYVSAYEASSMASTITKGVYYIPSNAVISVQSKSISGQLYYSLVVNKVTATRNHRFVTTNYGYVNSPDHNAYPPSVSDGYTYTALGQIGAKANITTGKYTGTGKYGDTNLNSLTFSFSPKAIFIIPVATSMDSYSGQFGAFLYGAKMCSTRFDGSAGSTQCNVTITGWGTNTIKWFGASSNYQLNDSNKEYRYVAIG